MNDRTVNCSLAGALRGTARGLALTVAFTLAANTVTPVAAWAQQAKPTAPAPTDTPNVPKLPALPASAPPVDSADTTAAPAPAGVATPPETPDAPAAPTTQSKSEAEDAIPTKRPSWLPEGVEWPPKKKKKAAPAAAAATTSASGDDGRSVKDLTPDELLANTHYRERIMEKQQMLALHDEIQTRKLWGAAVGGGGLGILATGLVLFATANSGNLPLTNDGNGNPKTTTDDSGNTIYKTDETNKWVGLAAMATGAVLAGVGTWLFYSMKDEEAELEAVAGEATPDDLDERGGRKKRKRKAVKEKISGDFSRSAPLSQ